MSVTASALPPVNVIRSFVIDILKMVNPGEPDHHAIGVTFETEQGFVSSFGISKALALDLIARLADALQEHEISDDIDALESIAEKSGGSDPKLLAIWNYITTPLPSPPKGGLKNPRKDFVKVVDLDAKEHIYTLDLTTQDDDSVRFSLDPFLARVFREQLIEAVSRLN